MGAGELLWRPGDDWDKLKCSHCAGENAVMRSHDSTREAGNGLANRVSQGASGVVPDN